MSEFSVFNLPQGAIQYLYSLRDTIWLDPPYQRVGDIWTRDKKQLLVDSVINGFDIPKLYFHELMTPRKINGVIQRYAIIDGKQRLGALWGFMDGTFALSDNFEYLHDPEIEASGLSYQSLGQKYPHLKSRFDATSLAVVAVRTDDIELIEDMFSRLNEAVPLNAPEKRNAFGGPLPSTIRELSGHQLFATRLPFTDRRFRHRDLATKFLMVESEDEIVDTKKGYLDDFVKQWADEKRTKLEAHALKEKVEVHLDRMSRVFREQDELLRSVGMCMIIYHYFRFMKKIKKIGLINRNHFVDFENARYDNRQIAEVNWAQADYKLLEFDKYVQTPNDAYATMIRLSILVEYMRVDQGLDLPESHRYFDPVP